MNLNHGKNIEYLKWKMKKVAKRIGVFMEKYINVIGGGLAGAEAAYQIAKRGIKVKLL